MDFVPPWNGISIAPPIVVKILAKTVILKMGFADTIDWLGEFLYKKQLEKFDQERVRVIHHFLHEEVKRGGEMVCDKYHETHKRL